MCVCVASVGGAAVVGDVLQAAEQGGVVVRTNPLGRRLLLQRHAALPGRSLSGPDHAVDLLQALVDTENVSQLLCQLQFSRFSPLCFGLCCSNKSVS